MSQSPGMHIPAQSGSQPQAVDASPGAQLPLAAAWSIPDPKPMAPMRISIPNALVANFMVSFILYIPFL